MAIFWIWLSQAVRPYRWTVIRALMSGVRAFLRVWAEMFIVAGSGSIGIGVSPAWIAARNEAMYVLAGIAILSPGERRLLAIAAFRIMVRASRPLLTATACDAPVRDVISASRASTSGPPMYRPDLITDVAAWISWGIYGAFASLRSRNLWVLRFMIAKVRKKVVDLWGWGVEML